MEYGPKFAGDSPETTLTTEQNIRVQDIYSAAEKAIKAAARAREVRADTRSYADMKAGDGVDDAPTVHHDAEQEVVGETSERPAVDPYELFADVQPEDPAVFAKWKAIVDRMLAATDQKGVTDAYAECEKEGLIRDLPEMDGINIRTVRYRLRNTKGKAA